jgi:hypothetical protein
MMDKLSFWQRSLSFLAREILWGWLAWTGLVLTLLAGLVFAGVLNSDSQFLSILPLVFFAFGGILIGNRARRHPFLNALAGSIFCIGFAIILIVLYTLGAGLPMITAREFGGTVVVLIGFIVPQLLVGAGIAVSFRRIRELGQRVAEDKQSQDQEATRSSQKRGSKEPASKQPSEERKKT